MFAMMKMRKTIFILLLTGMFFQITHDFVLFKVDPCMKHIGTTYKINNDYCEIHENLHMPYIKPFIYIPINKNFQEFYSFVYENLSLDPFISEIFKPPKQLS